MKKWIKKACDQGVVLKQCFITGYVLKQGFKNDIGLKQGFKSGIVLKQCFKMLEKSVAWSLLIVFFGFVGCQTSEEDKQLAHNHFKLGVSFYAQNKLEMGLKHLLIAVKLDPQNALIRNHLGVAYYLQKEYEHAVVSFEDALNIDENYSEARNNLARVLIDMKEFTKARMHLQKASVDLTYPNKDKIWLNFGLSYIFDYKYEKSLNFFLRSIAANRKNCLAHAYYGRALVELEKFKKATSPLDKAIFHCQGKGFDQPHYYAGIAFFRSGQKLLAKARLQEAVKLYPRGPYRGKIGKLLDLIEITDVRKQ